MIGRHHDLEDSLAAIRSSRTQGGLTRSTASFQDYGKADRISGRTRGEGSIR